jgi:hypothetical protein
MPPGWDGGLSNFLPGLALNYNPSDVSLPSRYNYRYEPLAPSWERVLRWIFWETVQCSKCRGTLEIWERQTSFQALALLMYSLDEFLNPSEPQFPHSSSGEKDIICFWSCWKDWIRTVHMYGVWHAVGKYLLFQNWSVIEIQQILGSPARWTMNTFWGRSGEWLPVTGSKILWTVSFSVCGPILGRQYLSCLGIWIFIHTYQGACKVFSVWEKEQGRALLEVITTCVALGKSP